MNAHYSDTILRWSMDLRRAGVLENADGVGEVGLQQGEIGRRLAVRFAVRVSNGHVATVRFQVFGCGFTIAACAAAAELAEGRRLAEVIDITPEIINAALGGLPEERDYCARLAGDALQAAAASVRSDQHPVTTTVAAEDDHTPRLAPDDRVYRLLIGSPTVPGAPREDRHLFACALAVAAGEPYDLAAGLGLSADEIEDLLLVYFPGVAPDDLDRRASTAHDLPPKGDAGILNLLLDSLPLDADGVPPAPSLWLARILSARAAHSGHLWRAMGLFARPELTAGIRRHLPSLAAANDRGMRWKRFLYKKLCEQGGGAMCRTPDCGICSEYALCFEEPLIQGSPSEVAVA